LYPIIERSVVKYSKQVNFVSLVVSDRTSLLEYVHDNNISIPVTQVHPDPTIIEEFNTKSFPFAYLLSPNGVVVHKGGVLNEELFNLLIVEGLSMSAAQRKMTG